MSTFVPAASFFLCIALSGSSLAQETLPFPFRAAGERLTLDAAQAAPLAGLREVVLSQVPVPGGGAVELQLSRVALAPGSVYLDGAPTSRALDADVSLWSGHVMGQPRSDVFLALSPLGSRGWVRLGDDLFHLIAEPGADGDWSRSQSRFVSEAGLRAMGAVPAPICSSALSTTPFAAHPPSPAAGAAAATGSPLPLYRCDVDVETDWQYFQVFGNLGAAQTYAVSLFGAVSQRYREQIGTILTMPYLGLHSNSNDGWTTEENGGDTLALLNEFQAKWTSTGPPVPAHLFHFFSGADLGGGIAYLPGLCDPTFGFGVSANLAGNTPFPIVQGPLNWDFMVVAHELGHNFGSPHTHDFCPPLDECFAGQCTAGGICTVGTLMSYCHLCPTGLANIDPVFHPGCVAVMRPTVESSCLPLYVGIPSQQSLGNAKPGSNGTPSLTVQFVTGPNRVRFTATSAPIQALAVLIAGDATLLAPFFGGVLVPTPQYAFGFSTNATGSGSLDIATAFSAPSGVTLYTQAWFVDGSSLAATNGLAFEIVLP